jgi:hypothetical protein
MKSFLVWLFLAPIVLWVTGWDVGTAIVLKNSTGIHLEDNGIFFRFGSEWYGVWFEPRYFDAPIVSWVALGLVTGVLFVPFAVIF